MRETYEQKLNYILSIYKKLLENQSERERLINILRNEYKLSDDYIKTVETFFNKILNAKDIEELKKDKRFDYDVGYYDDSVYDAISFRLDVNVAYLYDHHGVYQIDVELYLDGDTRYVDEETGEEFINQNERFAEFYYTLWYYTW